MVLKNTSLKATWTRQLIQCGEIIKKQARNIMKGQGLYALCLFCLEDRRMRIQSLVISECGRHFNAKREIITPETNPQIKPSRRTLFWYCYFLPELWQIAMGVVARTRHLAAQYGPFRKHISHTETEWKLLAGNFTVMARLTEVLTPASLDRRRYVTVLKLWAIIHYWLVGLSNGEIFFYG
jgi:hypothetical protein